jgi:hypothetical protein
MSCIRRQSKQWYIGHFHTELAAHLAHKRAAVELSGEFSDFIEVGNHQLSPTMFRPLQSIDRQFSEHPAHFFAPLGFGS